MLTTLSHPEPSETPFTIRKDVLRVQVRVAPKASADAIRGLHREADGTVSLKVAVTAAPEDGKANAAVIRTLAKALKLQKSYLSVVAGKKDRRKSIEIIGDVTLMSLRIAEYLNANETPKTA